MRPALEIALTVVQRVSKLTIMVVRLKRETESGLQARPPIHLLLSVVCESAELDCDARVT